MRNSKSTSASIDVVLMQLPFWAVSCPPLALGLLKSYLVENGISCTIIDINSHVYAIKGKKYYCPHMLGIAQEKDQVFSIQLERLVKITFFIIWIIDSELILLI